MVTVTETLRSQFGAALLGSALAVSLLGGASAADLGASGGYKDKPAEAAAWAFTGYVAGTTDYIFRGISQDKRLPTAQGEIDLSYGIFYAGAFVSGIDFRDPTLGNTVFDQVLRAHREVDLYGGIKPKWGDVTFDFGAIWYVYPRAEFRNPYSFDPEYVEAKFGVSGTVLKDVSVGLTVFYSPDYAGQLGDAVTIEGTASKSIWKKGDLEVALSGTVGTVQFSEDKLPGIPGTVTAPLNSYVYYNVGATLTIKDHYSFDVRYYGTDLDQGQAPAGGNDRVFQAGDAIVGTAKVSW